MEKPFEKKKKNKKKKWTFFIARSRKGRVRLHAKQPNGQTCRCSRAASRPSYLLHTRFTLDIYLETGNEVTLAAQSPSFCLKRPPVNADSFQSAVKLAMF